ncbi:transporter [Formosa sediminum]|uniref:Transporter n=1 Tax=Formosa sediminum TaxID=2594004 RepID=A0A516GU74_9FLAO|nr:transporter [Formosa sediminum]QDO95053.1 transporter [Formosa sediminum]
MKIYITIILCAIPLLSMAQYTDVINSNRPGVSKSAYAVGVNVIQVEAGPYYIKEKHDPLNYDVSGAGVDFAARYGLLWEPLEIIVDGTFQADTQTYHSSIIDDEISRSNMKYFSMGAKYLVYDPNKKAGEDKPNLYSWKANRKFKWSRLIPAVSIYAGANYDTEFNPYTPYGIEGFSPKIGINTQHNFTNGWVFIMNLYKNRIGMEDSYGTDASDLQYIFTLTHSFGQKWVAFGEYQGIKNDFYADDLFRLGGAYLFSKDLQFDTALTFNVKDTPSVFSLNFGASYRLDLHKDKVIDNNENGTSAQKEAERLNNKDYYKFGEDEDAAPTEYKMD